MDLEQVRKYCLSLPHVTERVQWGNDLLFCIGEKMFAVAGLDAVPHSHAPSPNAVAVADALAPGYQARLEPSHLAALLDGEPVP